MVVTHPSGKPIIFLVKHFVYKMFIRLYNAWRFFRDC